MPDAHGWPDPARPGIPAIPERPGPHLILVRDGKRRWMWWEPSTNQTPGGWLFTGGSGPATTWDYLGPAVTPDGKQVP